MLRDPEGFPLGIMAIEDIWQADREKEAMAVYGTTDMNHDEVARLHGGRDRYYVGGSIEALNLPIHSDFKQIRNTPPEVRQQFCKLDGIGLWGFRPGSPFTVPSSS